MAAIIGELYEGVNHEKPSLREITKQVAKHFRLKVPELTGTSRRQGIVHPPAWPFTFVADLGTSYEELGRHFGGRDHTTILHAFQRAGGGRNGSGNLPYGTKSD